MSEIKSFQIFIITDFCEINKTSRNFQKYLLVKVFLFRVGKHVRNKSLVTKLSRATESGGVEDFGVRVLKPNDIELCSSLISSMF